MMLKTFPLKPSFEENEDKDKVLKLGDDSLKLAEEEFKHAREIRSMEALKVKDDQIKLLSEQNNTLLRSLNRMEDEFTKVQLERASVLQDRDQIDQNLSELDMKNKILESQLKRLSFDYEERVKELKLMSDQNSELLRASVKQEDDNLKLSETISNMKKEYSEIQSNFTTMVMKCKTYEESYNNLNRDCALKTEEIRLLRIESDQFKQANSDIKMKVEVEIEHLQEQLRVRKEKQYHLLEKVNIAEESKRHAEDQVANLEDQIRSLKLKCGELETNIQVEMRCRNSAEENNKQLQQENLNLTKSIKDIQIKVDTAEKNALKSEAEARDSSEQLREMAEKVFQLLERLKLTELSKTKAMETSKKRENEVLSLTKQSNKLANDLNEMTKLKDRIDAEKKESQEQLKAIRKHNQNLIQKSKDDAAERLGLIEQLEQLKDTLKLNEARLTFLVNKSQADEDSRILSMEDRKKLESQVMKLKSQTEEYQRRVNEFLENERTYSINIRAKQDELNILTIKYEDVIKELRQRDAEDAASLANDSLNIDSASMTMLGAKPGAPDDIENVRLNEGRGRFYLEAKTTGAGAILLLKGRKSLYTDWLGKFKINEFLRKAQKTTRFRELMIERLAMTLGLLMVEEEEKGKLLNDITSKDRYTEQLIRSIELLQQGLATEEEAKRRMLLRYVHITKEYAIIQSNIRVEGTAVGLSGGILQLTDSNTTDEEVHALSALLRNDTSIEELYLRNNTITDDGARAIGAILSNHKNIRLIDLRGNKIGKPGVRILAEALEKSDRVSHVYVHIGGKIEALGETSDARSERMKGVEKAKNSEEIMSGKLSMNHIRKKPDPINQNENLKETDQAVSNIGTICIVDVRENTPTNTDGLYNQLQALDAINFVRPQYNQVSSGLLSGQQELLTSTLAQISGTGDNLNNNPSSPTSKGIKSLVKLNKGQKRQEKSELQMDGNGLISNPSDPNLDEKKSKNKMIENMKLALRENLWQGRSGGFDINTSQSLLNDLSSPILKSSPSQLSSSQDGLGIAVTRPSGSSSHKTKKNRKLSVPLSTSESVNADVNLENSFKQAVVKTDSDNNHFSAVGSDQISSVPLADLENILGISAIENS